MSVKASKKSKKPNPKEIVEVQNSPQGEDSPVVEAEPEEIAEVEIIEPVGDFFIDEAEPHEGREALPPVEVLPSDPLKRYLAEISRHPLLTPEEEEELSRRYVEEKDLDAAYRMVVSNLRLVVKIAYEFRRNIDNLLDLIQEGNIGLMRAVEKFDPSRGVRLSSYSAWWIRAYIIRYILNNWSLVKIGTTQNQRRLFFNLKKEKELLESQGFKPGPKLLAAKLDVKEEEVVEMQMRLAGSDLSLDTPIDEDSDATRLDFVSDGREGVESIYSKMEFGDLIKKKLNEFRDTLTGRDLELFDERLIAADPVTLRELGERFGVSRERVRQLEEELKGRLKKFLSQTPEVAEVYEN